MLYVRHGGRAVWLQASSWRSHESKQARQATCIASASSSSRRLDDSCTAWQTTQLSPRPSPSFLIAEIPLPFGATDGDDPASMMRLLLDKITTVTHREVWANWTFPGPQACPRTRGSPREHHVRPSCVAPDFECESATGCGLLGEPHNVHPIWCVRKDPSTNLYYLLHAHIASMEGSVHK